MIAKGITYTTYTFGGIFMRHFEPLRPGRSVGSNEKYEFAHGFECINVYDIHTLAFIKSIPVGKKPDCHAATLSNKYLYVACLDGLYIIDETTLTVCKILETGPVYATNTLPHGDTMLVHDERGGIYVIKDIDDMEEVHIYKRLDILHELAQKQPRVELGGKGNFLMGERYYLCAGWISGRLFLIDTENDFAWSEFMSEEPDLFLSDDLVITSDKKRAFVACHRRTEIAHVAVIDIEKRKIKKLIPTGHGTCGLTMTADEHYVIASNDKDDSISVIDAEKEQVINTLSAREGFRKLGYEKGYIQGITAARDDSIFVYECSEIGAIVKFDDIIGQGSYAVSCRNGKAEGNCK